MLLASSYSREQPFWFKGQVMKTYPPLRYHQATVDLLQAFPLVSPTAMEALNHLQYQLPMPLPASVREWYSLQQATDWLAEYSNDDHPIPVEQFTVVESSRKGRSVDKQARAQPELMPILQENQYVWTWALRLTGTQDPPVVVALTQTEPGTHWHWEPYAVTFSTFVYTRMWDYQGLFSGHALWGDVHCTLEELRFLQAHFTEEPQTVIYPTPITYRFSQGTERVLLWYDEAGSQWALSAASEDALEHLLDTIGSCGALAEGVRDLARFER